MNIRVSALGVVCAVYPFILLAAPKDPEVTISRAFFNPSVGQTISIEMRGLPAGLATLDLIDRDNVRARRLAASAPVADGDLKANWDGRLDDGSIAPDEAYSFVLEVSGNGVFRYAPAERATQDSSVIANYYDSRGGVLSYSLMKPSRVHIQAGAAVIDPKSHEPIGPVLRTLANREPRIAGPVIEMWNGMDESGTIRVAALPHFRMAIAATSLPDHSVITVGNRSVTFPEYVLKRRGQPVAALSSLDHHQHHQGLTTLQDVAPTLELRPAQASYSAKDRIWEANGRTFRVAVHLAGPSAEAFGRLQARVVAFVDERPVFDRNASGITEVTFPRLSPGEHNLAVNWATDFGPVAVNAMRVRVPARVAAGKTNQGEVR